MIDKDKKYQTRDGHDVRIYATDGDPDLPIHGAWKNDNGDWIAETWTADGRIFAGEGDYYDLIEVTPERVVWINEYKGGYAIRETRDVADRSSANDRIALHRVVLGKDTRVDD